MSHEEFSRDDIKAAGDAMDRWHPDSRDGKAQAFHDGFRAGVEYACGTPGPGTVAMVAKIAKDVKYEEERVARNGGVLEDEDEENTWYTIGEARAFVAENEPAKAGGATDTTVISTPERT